MKSVKRISKDASRMKSGAAKAAPERAQQRDDHTIAEHSK